MRGKKAKRLRVAASFLAKGDESSIGQYGGQMKYPKHSQRAVYQQLKKMERKNYAGQQG